MEIEMISDSEDIFNVDAFEIINEKDLCNLEVLKMKKILEDLGLRDLNKEKYERGTEKHKLWAPNYDYCLNVFDTEEEALESLSDYIEVGSEIELCGFHRIEADIDEDYILEHCIEYLDENYSQCAEDTTEITDEMRSIVSKFRKELLNAYISFDCFPNGEIKKYLKTEIGWQEIK